MAHVMEDVVVWREDVRGVYGVASGYLWLGKNYRDWNVTPNFSWIWKTTTQRKIQFFIWLIGQGALPTNSLRFQRHMAYSAKCSRCSTTDETILHALRDCPHSLEIWMRLVWVFKNGVVRLVENPGAEAMEGSRQGSRKKILVHTPSGEVMNSYAVLERKLSSLGWERYYDDPDLLQFHKRSTVHLISLPRDFNKLKSMHMYDIVVKNKNFFEVRDSM
ncbi:hypothetical protein RIF29_08061 [Crotalaria pallida]|uniref:Reverse transcriptase zinc-binding domain-containing protein n=1 Tax=Crotalaria pallida TaxID=3830 RepID=A0AAN9J522_CROPI